MTGPAENKEAWRECASSDDSIAQSVLRHKVRLSVYRDYGPDEKWRQRPVGFDVELRGLVLGGPPRYHAAIAAYEALRRIGAWAFSVLDANPEVAYEFDAFDQHVIVEGPLIEVELCGHIYHRNDVCRPLDDKERQAVDQIRHCLRSAGVRT
jgi:hypothetical protein